RDDLLVDNGGHPDLCSKRIAYSSVLAVVSRTGRRPEIAITQGRRAPPNHGLHAGIEFRPGGGNHMTRSRVPRPARASFYGCCVGASVLMTHGVVRAQDQAEEILVTGSRITRTTMDTPQPMTVMSGNELQNMAPANLIDGLSELPQ